MDLKFLYICFEKKEEENNDDDDNDNRHSHSYSEMKKIHQPNYFSEVIKKLQNFFIFKTFALSTSPFPTLSSSSSSFLFIQLPAGMRGDLSIAMF